MYSHQLFKNQLLIIVHVQLYDTLDRGHIYKEVCRQLSN